MTIPGEAPQKDLALVLGTTFSPRFVVTDNAAGGSLVDFTNYTAHAQVRLQATPDTAAADFDLTTTNGGVTLGGSQGTVDLLISATATAAIARTHVGQNAARYGVFVTDASGVVTPLVWGFVEIIAPVVH